MNESKNPVINNFVRPVLSFFHVLNKKEGFKTFISGLICIIIGLFFGFIIMLCVYAPAAFPGLGSILSNGFRKQNISTLIYSATPMILSGLSIAFAFKLKLFNIGITGQLTLGAYVSIVMGLAGANWVVCLLLGAIAGAFVGFISGFLKAKFNVNEVLSGIMLNWIIYYSISLITDLAIPSSFIDRMDKTKLMMMPVSGRLPSMGLDKVLPGVSVGIIISILLVIVIYIVLNKTNFGLELKMTGSNKYASKYAGVNQTRSIILALTISGALAGICGYMIYANPLSPAKFMWKSDSNSLLSDGFNGISVSLIGQNSPLGCILAAFFLCLVNAAQDNLKTISNSAYNIHYTELIKNIIIYVAAISSFINMLIVKYNNKNDKNYLFNMPIDISLKNMFKTKKPVYEQNKEEK